MMAEPVYNEAARRRIDATVIDRENGAFGGRLSGVIPRAVMWLLQVKLGKTDSSVTKGNTGTVSEYVGGTSGSESDTGDNYTVYFRYADVASGKWVLFLRLMGNWEAIAAECS
jgi:hypothetical protein